MIKNIKSFKLLLCTVALVSPLSLYATLDEKTPKSKDWVVLPYGFSSEAMGVVGGIGVIKQGLIQPQTTLVATLLGGLSENILTQGKETEANFSGAFLYFSDYKLPFNKRLSFSIMGLKSYSPRNQYYVEGSNNSKKEHVFSTSGDSNFFNTVLNYVFPIGEGLENPDNLYTLKNGMALHREGLGNGIPFVTGRTVLGLKSFYQKDTFENAPLPLMQSWSTNGLRLSLTHDNTDFNVNPSRGYHFEIQYSEDFGQGSSSQSWDFLEFKYNHYIALEPFSFTRQNVLAMSLWTGYSNSWENNEEIYKGINAHRPPVWEGARLGGLFKMRGYDNNRFSDKAVFYATAEYRMMLNYNPLKQNDYIPVAVDWFQLVAFGEAGRVNDAYNFELLSDMKYDVGLSLRSMVSQLPIRLDIAYSEEGTNMWLMINQPFDF
ncbi:MAG: BamA/TamA family outer membrane protein [Sulfurovum sp.]|nr:BamA/TamA family outer membrane protein [Sulfurovum sp.]